MISYVHSTGILVKDQDAALDFYVNKLGWEKRIDEMVGDSMRFLTVAPKGAQTEIILCHPTNFTSVGMISLIAEDLEETYADFEAKGVKLAGPIETQPWGAKSFMFDDLDGTSLFVTTA